MTTKKKWAIGIGVFLALGLLGSVLDDGKGSASSENKTESQQSVQTEQKQETEADRKAKQQKEEADRKAREQKEEADRIAREQKEEADRIAREQKEKQAKKDAILKYGYDTGYKNAIQYTYKMDHYCRNAYITKYGAPQSDEEIELYRQFVEQYDKGWDAGREVRDKM